MTAGVLEKENEMQESKIVKKEVTGDPPPTKPFLPQEFEQLLKDLSEWRFQPEWKREPYGPLQIPTLSSEQAAEIDGRILPQYIACLSPAPTNQISGRVTSLLAHYFVPDMPEELYFVVINDWIDALSEYPFWAIQESCGIWLRSENRRPTPSDIRISCSRAVKRAKYERNQFCHLLAEHQAVDQNSVYAIR